ncbi:hypothetical protein QCE62_07045 [Caballeronia sp. LZ033]|uniref:hypothetical protein n=1 Tax=Caballeronia sp. LZ033 TaxID=3038566 RepID=UPI0028637A45|nr:hypothetical protein [Caballeronia sp. LZ033]MDR5813348.1 hypothetical protein [Caballeronia sp. LZ033]
MLTGPDLGRAISQAIEKKGVTKKAFADAMGVRPASVQDWIKYGRLAKHRINDLVDYFGDVVSAEYWGLDFVVVTPAARTEIPLGSKTSVSSGSVRRPTAEKNERVRKIAGQIADVVQELVASRVMVVEEVELLLHMLQKRLPTGSNVPQISSNKIDEVMAAIEKAESAEPTIDSSKKNDKARSGRRSA